MEQLGTIYCDHCGNEITLSNDDKDFVCDECGDQVCGECISFSGSICLNCADEDQ